MLKTGEYFDPCAYLLNIEDLMYNLSVCQDVPLHMQVVLVSNEHNWYSAMEGK